MLSMPLRLTDVLDLGRLCLSLFHTYFHPISQLPLLLHVLYTHHRIKTMSPSPEKDYTHHDNQTTEQSAGVGKRSEVGGEHSPRSDPTASARTLRQRRRDALRRLASQGTPTRDPTWTVREFSLHRPCGAKQTADHQSGRETGMRGTGSTSEASQLTVDASSEGVQVVEKPLQAEGGSQVNVVKEQ
jgi:hypothetical protein